MYSLDPLTRSHSSGKLIFTLLTYLYIDIVNVSECTVELRSKRDLKNRVARKCFDEHKRASAFKYITQQCTKNKFPF